MIPHVLEVQPLPDLKLRLHFDTGEWKIFNAAPYLDRGRFILLNDQEAFREVHVAFGTVEWSNGLDLDPEDLYQYSTTE